jgi:hypothetical protein
MTFTDWLKGLYVFRPPHVPNRIIVRESAYCLDGGSINLFATDPFGRPINILLVQRICPKTNPSTSIPGRLYYRSELVPIRSKLEAQIVQLLSEAEVQAPPPEPKVPERPMLVIGEDIKQFLSRTPEENCRAFIREIVEYVRSEKYIAFAEEVRKAN